MLHIYKGPFKVTLQRERYRRQDLDGFEHINSQFRLNNALQIAYLLPGTQNLATVQSPYF